MSSSYIQVIQRKLKKEPISRTFLNPTFQLTEDPDSLEYKVLKGEQLPRTLPAKSFTPNWGWVRHFHNNTENILIPKSAKYINEEILIATLNGKFIDTSPKNCTILPRSKLEILKESNK